MKSKGFKGPKSIPRILLIGAGYFGKNHLRVLKELDVEGKIELVGVAVRSKNSYKALAEEYGVDLFDMKSLTPAFLKKLDAVDIVTSAESHFDLAKKCIAHTNILVEKPLAMNEKDALLLEALARKHKKVLMVGHIFRYHPVSKKLKELVGKKKMPISIKGAFINPSDTDKKREASLELLHLFDIIDFIWNKKPHVVQGKNEDRVSTVHVRYPKNTDARFDLGWKGEERKRTLSFEYPDHIIEADFMLNIVSLREKSNGVRQAYDCVVTEELLRMEILDFISCLKGKKKTWIDGKVGAHIVSIAERALHESKKTPKVAVIGGGIFGTSIARELGGFCAVTLFEKNSDLMQEGSFINQFRHHYGYHYPRSDETVIEIKNSREAFEAIFKKAIVDDYPTYYGLAKTNSLVNGKEFIDFCNKHKLPYRKIFPSPKLLSREEMELCIKVPEPSYHHSTLKKIIKSAFDAMPKVKVFYNTTVSEYSLNKDGSKTLEYAKDGKKHVETFDYVVNATYANINHFTEKLGFKTHPLRVDLAEVLIVKLPIPPISLTVVDGPFATLMPTGNPNEFTLYHVRESILDRYVPKTGRIKKIEEIRSNRDAIFAESLKLFPILKEATFVESRVVHRGVRAYREHDDARMADLIEHGFGCWSILSGKILSSVSLAKRLATIMRNYAIF